MAACPPSGSSRIIFTHGNARAKPAAEGRRPDIALTAARAAAGATAVAAIAFGLWRVRSIIVSLFEIIPLVGPLLVALLVLAVGLPQSVHTALLALLVLVVVREFQSYVINPHVMGKSVGLSPLVTLVTVSVVGLIFGGLAVILAIPAVSAAATVIDVIVLGHEPPAAPPRRKFLPQRFGS